jgi:hypothetical protein
MNSSSNRSIAKLMAVALALGAGLILAVACGGGSSKPDAAKIYADAGKKMAAVTAFHIDASTEGGPNAGPFKADFVAPDKFQFSATFTDQNGQATDFGQIQTGNKFYIKNPFGGATPVVWYVYAEELFGPVGDAVGFVNGLWTKLSGLTLVGEEDMGGVAMYHLQGTVSPDLLGLVENTPKPTKDNTIDVWVGKKDSLVHRLKYAFSEASSTTTVDLSGFNDKSISVEAPSNPLPATEAVKQLIASASVEAQGCFRSAWGDAAFAELQAGTRLPTKAEHDASDLCQGGGGGATPGAPADNTPAA